MYKHKMSVAKYGAFWYVYRDGQRMRDVYCTRQAARAGRYYWDND